MSETSSEQALGKSIEVLSENTVREFACWSCEVNSSEWHYCFSHLKLAIVPYLMRHVQVSIPQCHRMSHNMEYAPPGQAKTLLLRVNSLNHFSLTALEAHTDHVICQGEETWEDDKLKESALVLMELRVMIRNDKFLASLNQNT